MSHYKWFPEIPFKISSLRYPFLKQWFPGIPFFKNSSPRYPILKNGWQVYPFFENCSPKYPFFKWFPEVPFVLKQFADVFERVNLKELGEPF